MKCSLELTPDMLAQIVCNVLEVNGYKADGLALYLDGQLVGYDRAVVPMTIPVGIEVFPPPRPQVTREQLNEMLYPNGSIGTAQFSGAGNATA